MRKKKNPIIHTWWIENVLNILVTFLHDFFDPLWIGLSESKGKNCPKMEAEF